MRKMRARYNGTCDDCSGAIKKGEYTRCDRRTRDTYHDSCAPTGAGGRQTREDREYAEGRAEAERYITEKQIYGDELVEQWEMENEMNPRNWDW
jgi:hypothetical protein